MFGLSLSETTTLPLAGATWTIGLLPLAKHDELTDAVDDANRPFRAHARAHLRADGALDQAAMNACDECTALLATAMRRLRPVYREAVRWGVRGCDALAVTTESAELAGRTYPVLAAAIVERLARVGGGSLVQRLGVAVLDANRLDEREVLGFK
jgi:hypothetical protein